MCFLHFWHPIPTWFNQESGETVRPTLLTLSVMAVRMYSDLTLNIACTSPYLLSLLLTAPVEICCCLPWQRALSDDASSTLVCSCNWEEPPPVAIVFLCVGVLVCFFEFLHIAPFCLTHWMVVTTEDTELTASITQFHFTQNNFSLNLRKVFFSLSLFVCTMFGGWQDVPIHSNYHLCIWWSLAIHRWGCYVCMLIAD